MSVIIICWARHTSKLLPQFFNPHAVDSKLQGTTPIKHMFLFTYLHVHGTIAGGFSGVLKRFSIKSVSINESLLFLNQVLQFST